MFSYAVTRTGYCTANNDISVHGIIMPQESVGFNMIYCGKAEFGQISRILEQAGFGDATDHCIETCTAVGAVYGNDGRFGCLAFFFRFAQRG